MTNATWGDRCGGQSMKTFTTSNNPNGNIGDLLT